jgi:hypothetical protein
MDKTAVSVKFKAEPIFRGDFVQLSNNLDAAIKRLLPHKEVNRTEALSVEVYLKLAFVLEKIFKASFTTPSDLKCKVVTLTDPRNNTVDGILFPCDSVPKTVPHYIVKVSSSQMVLVW